MSVTDGDRAKAEEVWSAWIASAEAMDVFIAEALAEEREKARAPFLALADDWERQAGLVANHDDLVVSIAASTLANVVRGIRRAAEETE